MSEFNKTFPGILKAYLNDTYYTLDNSDCNELSKFVQGLEDELAQYRAELAALKAANKWIPVEERLPEIGNPESYIVCVSGDGYAIARYTPYDTQDNCNWLSDAYGYLEVTHWRPLPEPPEVSE